MKIVGVGCGPGMVTEQAAQVIRSARFIYGSSRAIGLVKKLIPDNCTVRSISDFRNLSQLPENAVVLSTGDPMLAGLGYLPGEVVPGILISPDCSCPVSHLPFPDYHNHSPRQGV